MIICGKYSLEVVFVVGGNSDFWKVTKQNWKERFEDKLKVSRRFFFGNQQVQSVHSLVIPDNENRPQHIRCEKIWNFNDESFVNYLEETEKRNWLSRQKSHLSNSSTRQMRNCFHFLGHTRSYQKFFKILRDVIRHELLVH